MATRSLSSRSFQVGDWQVLPRQGRIRRAEETVHVSPRAMSVLVRLAEAGGEVVLRNELLDTVWPRMAVTQDALSQCIVELRRAFGDNARSPTVIETIPKSGIRLLVAVSSADSVSGAEPFDDNVPGPAPEHIAPVDRLGSSATPRPERAADPSARRRMKNRLYLAAILLLVVSITAALLYLQPQRQTLPNSVAVFPVANLSSDPEDTYIAAGLYEELLTQLTKISTLNVVRLPYSVQDYGARNALRDFAAKPNAETVLRTSLRYADGYFRITATLEDVTTGQTLWSDAYDGEFKEIFAVETDIAFAIASAMQAEFSLLERAAVEKRPTDSPTAHKAYLRAIDLEPGARDLALEYLDEAIEADPEFALAYAEKAQRLAGALRAQVGAEAADPSEWAELERLALESADRALEIEPDTWRAHLARVDVHAQFWRWSEAREAFEDAQRTTPHGVPRTVYGWDAILGQFDYTETIRRQREVVALNPLEASERWVLGLYYAYSHRARDAAEQFRAAIDLGPRNLPFHVWLAHAEGMLGNTVDALEELRLAELLPVAHDSSISLANLAYAYSHNGAADDARRLVALLAAKAPDRRHQALNWALAYLAVGDREHAREALETVIEKIAAEVPDAGFLTLQLINSNIYSDPILEEPVFKALRRQLRGK